MFDRAQLLGFLAALALRVINSTLRWKKFGINEDRSTWNPDDPFILVFWHGDQLLMPWVYRALGSKPRLRPIHGLVSMHSDGRIAANTLKYLSINCIDGSSSRGGARALIQLKRKLSQGDHVAITPDGPKGPHNIAKEGAVLLSSITNIPLLPVAIASQSAWRFRSWDAMFLPKPFSKITMVAGKRFVIPPNIDRDKITEESQNLTHVLNELKSEAERLCALDQ